MRRADRLFQIVQHLRARRLTTASALAGLLSVSERTIYRDIRDLGLSGVPVEGEAGVGYRLAKGFDVPPIMFTLDEVEALVTGARMVEAWGGPSLAAGSRSAVTKLTLALPASRRQEIESTRLFAPNFHIDSRAGLHLQSIRQAIQQRRKVRIKYEDGKKNLSDRIVWPLALYFWGSAWTLAAWCEARADYRSFRLDRMAALEPLDLLFQEQEGKSLGDFLARVRA